MGAISSDPLILFVTVPTVEVGETLASTLVEENLVACVQILPGIKSYYRWEGKVHSDPEVLLLMKTKAESFSVVEDRIVKLHPYDVPQIVATPLTKVHEPYLSWLLENTS